MDDFEVKYLAKYDAEHLITIDWSGQKKCGLDIEWNYDKQ